MVCFTLIHQGSSKEACIFWASFWMSSTSITISNSCHQFWASTTCPLHLIHSSYSPTGGSVGKWPSLSSLPAGPWKNLSTSGPSSGGGPRSNSASSLCHHGGLCAGEWAGLISGRALWHHLLHLWDLLFHQSQLQEGVWAPWQSQVMDQLSCSISSSKAVVAKAFWWVSLTLASWTLAETPPLSPHGVLLHVR